MRSVMNFQLMKTFHLFWGRGNITNIDFLYLFKDCCTLLNDPCSMKSLTTAAEKSVSAFILSFSCAHMLLSSVPRHTIKLQYVTSMCKYLLRELCFYKKPGVTSHCIVFWKRPLSDFLGGDKKRVCIWSSL